MGPSPGEITVFMRQLLLVSMCGWLYGMQGGTPHTRQSSKYRVSHKYSCFSWWWVHSRPKHAEIDKYKYTKNKLCTKLVLFSDIYPTRCNVTQFYYLWKLLCMFRVVFPPIIRSTHNCMYSIWHLSNRYCYLPLSWKIWNADGWRLVCWLDSIQPADQSPPIQSDKY